MHGGHRRTIDIAAPNIFFSSVINRVMMLQLHNSNIRKLHYLKSQTYLFLILVCRII